MVLQQHGLGDPPLHGVHDQSGVLGLHGAVGQDLLLVHRDLETIGGDIGVAIAAHEEALHVPVLGGKVHGLLQVDEGALLVLGTKQGHDVARALAVLLRLHAKGHRLALIGLAAHLVGVPVGVQQAQVHHAHIGTDALHLLGVPKREGVVVPIGEEDGVRRTAVQVVRGQVACGRAVAAVVVVPTLRQHDARHHQTYQGGQYGHAGLLLQHLPQYVEEAQQNASHHGHEQDGIADRMVIPTDGLHQVLEHAEAQRAAKGDAQVLGREAPCRVEDRVHPEPDPDGEGVERTHVGVVPLPRL